MPIDPKIEAPLRELLDHALHDRLDDVARVMTGMGDERYAEALALCVTACGYITADVAGRWPLEVDIREAARAASESVTNLPVTEDEQYAFLLRSTFGSEALDQVFPDKGKLATVPLFTLANLLISFTPKDVEWSDHLDTIWNSIEAAERAGLSALPALLYQHGSLGARTGKSIRPSTGQ